MTSGTLVHHSALSRYFHCVNFHEVSIRNHIVTGFNPYPDETCRARHLHHPLSLEVTVRRSGDARGAKPG